MSTVKRAYRYRFYPTDEQKHILARTFGCVRLDEPLAIVWSRPLPAGAQPSTVTVSRDPTGRYFVSLLVEEEMLVQLYDREHLQAGRVNKGGYPMDEIPDSSCV